jgi:hypothetical protein
MTEDSSEMVRLRVMQPGGNSLRHCEVSVTLAESVAELKKKVQDALGVGSDKFFLRLIASGRLLAPDSQSLRAFRSQLASPSGPVVVHAVVSAVEAVSPGARAMALTGNASEPSATTSDIEDEGDEDAREDGEGAGAHGRGRRTRRGGRVRSQQRSGFDRLRDHGLSRVEITSLRTFFAPQVNAFAEARGLTSGGQRQRQQQEGTSDTTNDADVVRHSQDGQEQQSGESERERQLRFEDAWIAAQGEGGGEFGINFFAGGNRRIAGLGGGPGFFFGAPGGLLDEESSELLGEDSDDAAALRRSRRARASDSILPFRSTLNGDGAVLERFDPSESEMGQPRDFVAGFLMGFLLGVIMLFWIWEQGPYRQKMGIMSGVCCQLALRYMKRSFDASASDGSVTAEPDVAPGYTEEDADISAADFTNVAAGAGASN